MIDVAAGQHSVRRPSWLWISWVWFFLGIRSIDSTAAQLDQIEAEIVGRQRWMSPSRFNRVVQSALALPGPETPQVAAYTGWLLRGSLCGLLSSALLLLPGLLIMLAATLAYLQFGQAPEIQALLYGLKPAILAAVWAGGIRLAQRTLTEPRWVLLGLLSSLLVLGGAPLLLILLLATAAGLTLALLAKDADAAPSAAGMPRPPTSVAGFYFLDDTPPHHRAPRPLSSRLWPAGIAVCLWALLIGALGWAPGTILQDLALFFSKIAVMTFSSTYAVLPTVLQSAVEESGWLEASQLMDGLALAEATPGPVALIHVFIGGLSAAGHVSLLDYPVWQAAVAGGLVGGVFTFLPSLLTLMVIAPWLDAHDSVEWLQLCIRAIGAAVVAVILQLGLSFGAQVVWPEGLHDLEAAWRGADLMAVGLALLGLYLLISRRWAFGPVLLLLMFMGAGLVLTGLTVQEQVVMSWALDGLTPTAQS